MGSPPLRGAVIGGVLILGLGFVLLGGTKPAAKKPVRVLKNKWGFYVPVYSGATTNWGGERIASDAWAKVGLPMGNASPQENLAVAKSNARYLPSDAAPVQDKYTKMVYYSPQGFGYGMPETQFDEYGRHPGGSSKDPLMMLLSGAQIALPYIPGIGTAAGAALGAAIALGQGKSLKDAALAGARYALPAHLQVAFDIGVGIASGQSVDEVALNALDKQYPGAKAAVAQGKAMAS